MLVQHAPCAPAWVYVAYACGYVHSCRCALGRGALLNFERREKRRSKSQSAPRPRAVAHRPNSFGREGEKADEEHIDDDES